MSTYAKPHLTYERQLELIKSRGATCADDERAIRLLQAVGYYNLTGYLYPYRMPNPSGPGRLDTFQPGTSLDDVETLIDFDRKLRLCLLEGVQLVEVAIRAQIAYTLGRHAPFGHLDLAALDPQACYRQYQRGAVTKTAFEWWLVEYWRLQDHANREPFVDHNLTKYGEPLPIWIACEFLDFGAVANLFQLLTRSDRQAITTSAGLVSIKVLVSWLKHLNYVRNVCAHNQRLWNRVWTVRPTWGGSAPHDAPVIDATSAQKPYESIVITAYLLRQLNPDAGWATKAKAVLASFPDIPMRSIHEIGAPTGWCDQPIW